MKNKIHSYSLFLILSLILHMVLFLPASHSLWEGKQIKFKTVNNLSALRIHTIETNQIGSPHTLEFENKAKKQKKPEEKKLSLSDLSQNNFDPRRPRATDLLKQNKEKIIHTDGRAMKKFIAGSGSISANDMLSKLGHNDISVSFGIPEDFQEDEHNKAELIFYGFRRRLLQAYLSSFFTHLNNFNHQNPHLSFPMTEDAEVMTGQVTYDSNGNIVRIKMLRWTNKQRLQDFFVEVLENLGKLPNPPNQIVRDGRFHVYYTLNIQD